MLLCLINFVNYNPATCWLVHSHHENPYSRADKLHILRDSKKNEQRQLTDQQKP
jgi:hypothetical protein